MISKPQQEMEDDYCLYPFIHHEPGQLTMSPTESPDPCPRKRRVCTLSYQPFGSMGGSNHWARFAQSLNAHHLSMFHTDIPTHQTHHITRSMLWFGWSLRFPAAHVSFLSRIFLPPPRINIIISTTSWMPSSLPRKKSKKGKRHHLNSVMKRQNDQIGLNRP